jgi:hypothetical protein
MKWTMNKKERKILLIIEGRDFEILAQPVYKM